MDSGLQTSAFSGRDLGTCKGGKVMCSRAGVRSCGFDEWYHHLCIRVYLAADADTDSTNNASLQPMSGTRMITPRPGAVAGFDRYMHSRVMEARPNRGRFSREREDVGNIGACSMPVCQQTPVCRADPAPLRSQATSCAVAGTKYCRS